MEVQKIYERILKNNKKLDTLYKKHKQLEKSFDKTQFLDTYLLGNVNDKMKEVRNQISELHIEQHKLSYLLRNQGYVINGRDYTLTTYDNEKMHVASALYNFLVQY